MDQESQNAIIESLETLSHADGYYRWLVTRLSPYIRGKTLEVGAGIGNFARWARHFASEYHVSDVDQRLVSRLQQDFNHAFLWDIYDTFPFHCSYDTIIVLNVIEHLEDDRKAVDILRQKLVPGGHVIIMVPAMPFLFGSLDRSFGHFRRYKKSIMKKILNDTGLRLIHQEYVNVVGMLGWLLYGRILKYKNLPEQVCEHFNLFLPLVRMERPLAYFMGLSLISIGQK